MGTQSISSTTMAGRTESMVAAASRPARSQAPDRLDEMRRRDALRSIAYIKRCYEQRLPIPRLG